MIKLVQLCERYGEGIVRMNLEDIRDWLSPTDGYSLFLEYHVYFNLWSCSSNISEHQEGSAKCTRALLDICPNNPSLPEVSLENLSGWVLGENIPYSKPPSFTIQQSNHLLSEKLLLIQIFHCNFCKFRTDCIEMVTTVQHFFIT